MAGRGDETLDKNQVSYMRAPTTALNFLTRAAGAAVGLHAGSPAILTLAGVGLCVGLLSVSCALTEICHTITGCKSCVLPSSMTKATRKRANGEGSLGFYKGRAGSIPVSDTAARATVAPRVGSTVPPNNAPSTKAGGMPSACGRSAEDEQRHV